MELVSTLYCTKSRALGPLPADHPPVKIGKVGVMLVNLGTPDGTDKVSMRGATSKSSCLTNGSSNGRGCSGIRSSTASF